MFRVAPAAVLMWFVLVMILESCRACNAKVSEFMNRDEIEAQRIQDSIEDKRVQDSIKSAKAKKLEKKKKYKKSKSSQKKVIKKKPKKEIAREPEQTKQMPDFDNL